MLVAADSIDAFHPWPAERADWAEAVWFGTWIPECATTLYIYHWFRPALGIYGGGCIVWDAASELPWDAPVFQYDVNRPIGGSLDLRDLSLDNGTRIVTLREGLEYRIAFRNSRVDIQLTFSALTPPDLTGEHGTEELFSGHLDQPGHYRGFAEIEGRRYEIDAFGIRDRSWGPRVIGDDIRLGYCHGEDTDTAFLAFSRPCPGEEPVLKGYLSVSGMRCSLRSGHRRVERSGGQLRQIDIRLTDMDGRTLQAVGRPLNRFSYMPYPNLLSRHYLMSWDIGGRAIHGEEQDLWSLPLWREHRRQASHSEGRDRL